MTEQGEKYVTREEFVLYQKLMDDRDEAQRRAVATALAAKNHVAGIAIAVSVSILSALITIFSVFKHP